MLYIKKNQSGFVLIGVLIVSLIICVLVYGGFFKKQENKNNKSYIENSVDTLETAKKDINKINEKININNINNNNNINNINK